MLVLNADAKSVARPIDPIRASRAREIDEWHAKADGHPTVYQAAFLRGEDQAFVDKYFT